MLWLTGKKNYKEEADAELIRLYRSKNNRDALGELFERYAHLVFSVCIKYFKDQDAARDATLQIFEKVMVDLKRFEVDKFPAWIHRVAKNHCLMEFRSRKTMIPIDEEDGIAPDRLHIPDAAGNLSLEKEAQLSLMEEAITMLNEDQRICIELFYLQKHSYQDVAEIGGFTLNEVKSHIQNGKRNIKTYMMNKNHDTFR